MAKYVIKLEEDGTVRLHAKMVFPNGVRHTIYGERVPHAELAQEMKERAETVQSMRLPFPKHQGRGDKARTGEVK